MVDTLDGEHLPELVRGELARVVALVMLPTIWIGPSVLELAIDLRLARNSSALVIASDLCFNKLMSLYLDNRVVVDHDQCWDA